jgi:hypothetical protein
MPREEEEEGRKISNLPPSVDTEEVMEVTSSS